LRCIYETSHAALCYNGSNFMVKGYVDLGFAGDLAQDNPH